jgi:hypothetical protein
MLRLAFFALVSWIFCDRIDGQVTLDYYLPHIEYDPSIPTPKQYLGYEVGEWHVSHDQLLGYFKALDAASPLIELKEYARTHEHRALVYVVITSKENHENLKEIKEKHQMLSDPNKAKSVDTQSLPAIVYQGYSIHGNESSGVNAALLVAYYLVAGKGSQVESVRKNTVILLDPCLNPDGVQRFSTWVNSHKGINEVSDPVSRELNEAWPGGRFNHYWFDMNRDWLPAVHPESKGRIATFHEWHPNVLTDHHEMGTNSTFFFQPGIPSSVNPNTPWENQIITEEIGKYHARALDSIGSSYYTKASFDDFYYGKGSTYPDALGCIGILFEQASSRGHRQESANGLLTFAFTIRNQVVTSLSTQNAVVGLRSKLLDFKKRFYGMAYDKIQSDQAKAYVFTDTDIIKRNRFLNLLSLHHIEMYYPSKDIEVDGIKFPKESSYIVPLKQYSPIIAKTIFEEVRSFQDSSFYDVSGWTLAHGYNLTFKPLASTEFMSNNLVVPTSVSGQINPNVAASYAYAITLDQHYAHTALHHLLANGIIVKHTQENITYNDQNHKVVFKEGTLIIMVQGQKYDKDALYKFLQSCVSKWPMKVYSLSSGNGTGDAALGHPEIKSVELPKVGIIVGSGIAATNAGDIWYHCDQELSMPTSLLELNRLKTLNLGRYNRLILPNGNYSSLSETELTKLKEWVGQGNTLVCIGSAAEWAVEKGLFSIKERESTRKFNSSKYADVGKISDAKLIDGTIFKTKIDRSHPLFYGYNQDYLMWMHSGTRFFYNESNPSSTPARYTADYQVSGYVPKNFDMQVNGSAVVACNSKGMGRVIAFFDSPLFRGYWYSGMKCFNNALFFGTSIDSRSTSSN